MEGGGGGGGNGGRKKPMEKVPGAHGLHASSLSLPGTGLALPPGHARQDATLSAPRSGLYVPAGHWVKAMAALAAPSEAQKPPMGQAVQLVERRAALYEPAGHGKHPTELPAVSLKVPGKHGMQLSALCEPLTGA